MRRAAPIALAAVLGAGLAVLVLVWGKDDAQQSRAVELDQGPAPASAGQDAARDPSAPSEVSLASAEPGAEPEPCTTCYDGVHLLEDRTADEIDQVRGWSDQDYTAAVEELWSLHEGGQLDFAAARRADQALLVDRLLGTDISAATRAALLDLHSAAQQAMADSPKTPDSAPAVTRAQAAYEDGAAELLTDDQLDRLLNGRPVQD